MKWIAGALAGQASIGIALGGFPSAESPAFWVFVAAVVINVGVVTRGICRAIDDAGNVR